MRCPICDSEPGETFQALYVPAQKCAAPNCGHICAVGPARGQGVQKHPNPDAEYEGFKDRNRRLVNFWRRRGLISDNSAILDVGSGAGHIVRAIREQTRQATIVCMEADPGASAYLRCQGFSVASSFDELDLSFDLILLIELIEHVADPVGLLTECRRRLAAEGRLFLTTPCGETTRGNRKTNAYETKEHIQFFTERSLRLACAIAGFSEVTFQSPNPMHPPGRGLAALRPALKAILRPLRDTLTGRQHLVALIR
jgi:SAM-dependent methyltransferase